METNSIEHTNYHNLVNSISQTFKQGRKAATQYIVNFEQKGKIRADYGEVLLERLSKDLSLLNGKGFSLSNIKRFQQFYLIFPNSATLSHQLSWSHYVELLKIVNELERMYND